MSTPRLVLLLVLAVAGFALLTSLAVRRQFMTFDEPLHLTSAYVVRYYNDFRVNPEDPPLFQRLAALALPLGSLQVPFDSPEFSNVEFRPFQHWDIAHDTMFSRPYAEVRPYVDAARRLMLLPAVLTVAGALLLARLLLRGLSPPIVAAGLLLAAALLCLDPTLLGHGSLIKNDVTLALAFMACTLACTLLFKRLTPAALALLVVGACIGVTTKFSGLLLGPLVAAVLLTRAVLPQEWPVARLARPLSRRWQRLLAACVIIFVCSAAAYAAVWAVYGFQSTLIPNLNRPADLAYEDMIARRNIGYKTLWRGITREEEKTWPLPLPMRASHYALQHRLLPDAFCKGFNFTYATTVLRTNYLLGELKLTGWWYYFPLTMLFKLPLATLAVLLAALTLGLIRRRSPTPPPDATPFSPLPALIISGLYFASAMRSDLNIGIRHLLPVLPIFYVLAAATLARAVPRLPHSLSHRLAARPLALPVVVAALLALEVLPVFPRYISFFNLPSRLYGPERLLGDSNLDWGQELFLVADWQARNPQAVLSSSTLGAFQARSVGIRGKILPPVLRGPERATTIIPPGYVAVSLFNLQQLPFTAEEFSLYEPFRRLRPKQKLGDTYFLYTWPPRPEDFSNDPLRLRLVRGPNVLYPSFPDVIQLR